MPLRVKCPTGHTLIVPGDRAGRTLRCPRCGADVAVPGGGAGVGDRGPGVGDRESAVVASEGEAPAEPRPTVIEPPQTERPSGLVPAATATPARAAEEPEPAENPFDFLTAGDHWAPPPPLAAQPPATAQLHADAGRTLAVYQLAAGLVAAAVLSVVPAAWDVAGYLAADEIDALPVARWALVVFFLGVVQLGYAVYLFQLPDWASVWVVTLFLLLQAAGYAGVLGIVLISDPGGFLVGQHGLQLADKLEGGQAALWCLCMVSVATILAFFAGRLSVGWQRAERVLRLAGR